MVDISSHKYRIVLPTATVLIVAAATSWLAITASTASTAVPTFAPASNFSAGTNPQAVGVGDFNADSKTDIAVVNRGSANVSIRLGDGAGGFGAATNVSVGTNPVSVAVGDFNGDGKADLAIANSGSISDQGSVSILLGDGAGSFAAPTALLAGMHPQAVAVADFNGDSKVDLAIANVDSNTISLLIGNGLGGFGSASSLNVGTNPRSVAVGDFNKDSKADLAVANSGSNTVSILIGNGNGGFAAAVNFGVGTAPFSVAVGDFNADTKPDIVTANNTSNDVSILLGDGAGGFATATNFVAAANPYSVVVGDFYGDGKLDVAVTNSGSASVSVLLGNGTGGLGTATNFAVGTDPRSLAVGNFNGDTKPDLLIPNFGSDHVSLLLNTSVVTALVSGTVKDAQNNPIAGATVEAINPSNQQVVASSVSDASGHYSVTVATGTYDLKATPPAQSTLRVVTIHNLFVVADLIQDITLVPPDVVLLSGRIVDRDGLGIPNLGVQLEPGAFGSGGPATRTAADGSYQLQTGQGTYFFRVFCRGTDVPTVPNAPGFVENGLLRSQSNLISLTQDTVRNVTLPTRIISGRVTDSNAQPVAGVQFTYGTSGSVTSNTADLGTVSFSGYSQAADGSSGTTDANGLYRIYALPATLPSISIVPPVSSGLAAQNLNNVDVQNDRSIDIVLQRPLTLSGRIVDRDGLGIPNLGVQLEPGAFGSGGPATRTAADGSYQLQTGQGTYFFRVFCRGTDVPTVPNAPGFVENGLLRSQSNLISLTQDTVRNVTLPTRIISGRVTDSNAQPVAGVQFTYGTSGSVTSNTADLGTVSFSGYSQAADGSSGTTDANGLYRIYALPATLPSISIVPPVSSGLAAQNLNNVDVQNDRSIDIVLQRPLTLSGRIVDRDGLGIPNLGVQLEPGAFGSGGPATRTAADGSYQLQTGQGTYFFRVFCRGTDVPTVPNAPGFVENGLLRSQSNLISLTQDTVRNVTLPTRIISGRVTDSNAQPVAGVQFTYGTSGNVTSNTADLGTVSFSGYSQAADGSSGTTDANGLYRIYALPATLPSISIVPPVSSGLAAQNLNNVDVQNDRSIDVVLQRPARTLSGRIADSTGGAIIGVTVTLSGSQSAISTTDGNGNYIFVNVSEGGNYTVTPSRTSYQFTPPNAVFNNLLGDQTANFTGTLFTFNVTGNVRDSGNAGVGGVTVTLSGATTAVTQTDNAGAYVFNSVAAFANYSVKPSKPGLTFTPARTDLNNLSANQTVDFTTAAQPSPSPTPPLDEDFGNTQRNPDKFNFGSLSTDPTAFDPLVSVQQQNGQLKITPRANAFGTHYNGYTTVSAVDVNTSTPSVEVVQTASEARTLFSLGSDVNNNFGFLVQPASAPTTAKPKVLIPKDATALLIFQITISGQLTALSIPYDPVAHRYWRFRYDPSPNAILFETSPDNITWAVQHNVVLQRSVTPMAIELSSGTSTTTTTPGTAVFDNFHLGDKFNITGQVKTSANAPVSGVAVSLTGSFARTSLTDANGNYAFAQLDAGGNYNVTPNLSGYTFSPISQIFNSLATNKTADFVAALNGPSPTPSPTPGVQTPAGSNVEVQSNGVHITFAQVTAAGMTTVTATNPASMGQLPGGYFLSASGVGFDISTTSSYLPPVDICFEVPAATDAAVFNSLAVLHNEGGQLIDRTTSRNFNSKNICGRVNSLSPFLVVEKTSLQYNSSSYSVPEGAGSVTITVTRLGHLSTSALVNFGTADGTAEQRSDYTAGAGTIAFSAGETTKTFEILVTDDLYVEGNETLTVSLGSPSGGAISGPGTVTLTITDNDTTTATTNPLDNADAQFFVRTHYFDFLSRSPDPGGLGFWAGTITQCGSDQTCLRNKRIDASNAFFYELEFQQTGAYVFRVYRVAFGNNQPSPNPFVDPSHPNEEKKLPSYAAFVKDRARVVGGASLAAAQLELANAFVERPEFLARYPATLSTAAQFVDALLATLQTDLAVNLGSQRDALINLYNTGGRGAVLYRLADDNALNNPINNRPLIDAEYTRAFVATQYFGYLRRDADIGGFLFWLGQVSSAPPRDVPKQHAMVCSFITSGEYQQRFSPVAPHSNSECPH